MFQPWYPHSTHHFPWINRHGFPIVFPWINFNCQCSWRCIGREKLPAIRKCHHGILQGLPLLEDESSVNHGESVLGIGKKYGVFKHQMEVSWVIEVPPVIIHFRGIFHEINQPAMGVPPWLWKPPYTVVLRSPKIGETRPMWSCSSGHFGGLGSSNISLEIRPYFTSMLHNHEQAQLQIQ